MHVITLLSIPWDSSPFFTTFFWENIFFAELLPGIGEVVTLLCRDFCEDFPSRKPPCCHRVLRREGGCLPGPKITPKKIGVVNGDFVLFETYFSAKFVGGCIVFC